VLRPRQAASTQLADLSAAGAGDGSVAAG
jgi:hypothetical protein